METGVPSVTSSKRKAGRKKFRETRHPIYHGVRERNGGKWVSELREPGKQKRIWLGTFPTAVGAARAYDVAAIALRGESAPLNFQDSAWALPQPKSKLAEDIRSAACEAAEIFGREFMDEEAVFNMPGLVDGMAEGMLLTPPAMKKGFNWDGDGDDDGEVRDVELSLWTSN